MSAETRALESFSERDKASRRTVLKPRGRRKSVLILISSLSTLATIPFDHRRVNEKRKPIHLHELKLPSIENNLEHHISKKKATAYQSFAAGRGCYREGLYCLGSARA